MKFRKHGTGKALALLLAGAALASCTAHGQGSSLDPKVYVNYTPYSEAFYRELVTGRVYLYAHRTGKFRNVVHGRIAATDGRVIECLPGRVDNKLFWFWVENKRWSLAKRRSGVWIELDHGDGSKGSAAQFYDPETGGFTFEHLKRGRWVRTHPGVIQDTWPRVLADGCANLKPPTGIRINEKQTSPRFDELRRQDPDAPIRHFPGSHLTAPGRTGLGASRGRPTTTRKEVWAFLRAQEGYVVTSPSGAGYVFDLDGGRNEVWRLADDGSISRFGQLREEGDWLFVEVPDQPVLRYPMGYPVPVLPTGHRHAAWQLTDKLIARAEPVPLSWMGERYSGHRFLFHDKTLTIVGPGETYLDGRWRWSKGRLEVTVGGDERNPVSIGWRDLARDLGVQPLVWVPSTPNAR